MKTRVEVLNRLTKTNFQSDSGNAIVDYYTDAGPDYEAWSKNFNMHFGYSIKKWDCLSREKMLQRMNEEVLKSLSIKDGDTIVDMGCGLGATIRYGAQNFPNTSFKGFTITPWQVKQSEILIEKMKLNNAEVIFGDYNQLPIQNNSINATFGLESISHADGTDKAGPICEAYRILKPGGTFTMVDGFIKKPENQLSSVTRSMYKTVCDNWALPSFPNVNEVVYRMKTLGFKEIDVKEISWQVAPSAVHAPFVTLFFFLKSLFSGKTLKKESVKNLKACFLIFFLGMCRSSIGYYKITAKK
jgi:cyclopropane fatty-acyl-phospholipid synthase-like methyltransferase